MSQPIRRLLASALTALLLAAAFAAVTTSKASAYHVVFCESRVLDPGQTCSASGVHSWEYEEAAYPGPPQHRVLVCMWLYSTVTNQKRSPGERCNTNFTAYWWDPTYDAWYIATVKLDPSECCRHTIRGFARTTN